MSDEKTRTIESIDTDGFGKPTSAGFRPEICICAAIRLPDGRIIRGHRHGDCIRTASKLINHRHSIGLEPCPWQSSMCEDQGFITSRDRYVDREEGLRLQLAAGVESACPSGYRKRELFSEDLY